MVVGEMDADPARDGALKGADRVMDRRAKGADRDPTTARRVKGGLGQILMARGQIRTHRHRNS